MKFPSLLTLFCGLVLLVTALCGSAAAAVVTYTLPIPYRTSLEQPMAGSPAVYHPVVAWSAYPIDFDGDGKPEFIAEWPQSAISLLVAQAGAEVVTTRFEEAGWNPFVFPLPTGVVIGSEAPGTTVKWGVPIDELRDDILGLGPTTGRYSLSVSFTGQGEGWWYRPWNRTLPEDWDYIGVRFRLDDGLHYGYLQFGYEVATTGVTPHQYAVLRGWAWETEPGKSILIVPEPGCGALLVAAGLLTILRRRRLGGLRVPRRRVAHCALRTGFMQSCKTPATPRLAEKGRCRLGGLALLVSALCGPASAAVVTYTLPIPYRTSLEQPMAGSPAVYLPVSPRSAYPIDFDGDGNPEFIADWPLSAIFLRVAQPGGQTVTTTFEEAGWNPSVFPLPIGVLIGADAPGTTVKWGIPTPDEQVDILGLGPTIGRYTMAVSFSGQGEGWWYRPWNRTLPEDWDYIGVRFRLDDGLHYGYLHFGYEVATTGVTPHQYAVLRGWAWETEPDKAILIVPESHTAGLCLAAGLLTILRRRRRG